MKTAKTWTMAQAKSDFERGLLKGAEMYFFDALGECHYTVSFVSSLPLDGSGALVDARTGNTREFKTMDAAHSAVRQVGFKTSRFLIG